MAEVNDDRVIRVLEELVLDISNFDPDSMPYIGVNSLKAELIRIIREKIAKEKYG